ncbi:alkaline phosphatase family protein [Streptomyces griseorubiginosus]|uniref:alkaline phosphatase family protein n=1 Tax=Streptomyces griseorubiginosus TaxID=67304 RepID=UPI00215A4337|nr:nucleotide pyrophosphatase/phosphodiesterase family protein [Streptomyces griseorubiginosus]
MSPQPPQTAPAAAATDPQPPAARPTPLLVLDVVGLTPRLLHHMPHLKSLARSGSHAPLGTVLPAVTCAAQSTFLTGAHPSEHGIVGNGWYFRELGDVLLWRQHNGLVAGDKLWDAARRARPGYTVANICWWYAMGADTDFTVTPRPVYYADGRKEPDCYTRPPALHDELTDKLGTFPLFHFWGPGADLVSSQWIIDATRHIMGTRHPDLTLCYLPHLDYDLQRFGPDDPRSLEADEGKKAHHLDHPRAGELVAVAEPDAWFTYYYWLDDDRAPDFAQLVEIHRKPGYDPVELFMDPLDPYVKVKAATALARKKLGLRYRMAVVPLDPSPIRGSHGRLPESDDDGPLLICSTPRAVEDRIAATDVKSLLLRLAGLA